MSATMPETAPAITEVAADDLIVGDFIYPEHAVGAELAYWIDSYGQGRRGARLQPLNNDPMYTLVLAADTPVAVSTARHRQLVWERERAEQDEARYADGAA